MDTQFWPPRPTPEIISAWRSKSQEFANFFDYIEKIRPWYDLDAPKPGETDAIRADLNKLGEAIYAKHGFDGLQTACNLSGMNRFVDLAFRGIGERL